MCSKDSRTLFWATNPVSSPLFGLGLQAPVVTAECHTLLLLSDTLQILGGFSDMYTLNGLGSFMGVLKVNTKVQTS